MRRRNVNLKHLIDELEADLSAATPLAKITEAQQRAHLLADTGDNLVGHFVTQARHAGVPWSQIGTALGVSKQAAQQRWTPVLFSRFTDRARRVYVVAHDKARGLRHASIGTEHLLLGLLAEPDGVGAKVIQDLTSVSAQAFAQKALAGILVGDAEPLASMPLSDQGKKALTEAMDEALSLGHNYVDTEHLLLGLLRVPDATATKLLAIAGVHYDNARKRVVARLEEMTTAHRAPGDRAAGGQDTGSGAAFGMG